MTQVFLTNASTSPWSVPSDFLANTGNTPVTFTDSTGSVTSFTSSAAIGNSTITQGGGSTFSSGSAGSVTAILTKLYTNGSPADNLVMKLWSGSPATGSVIGTADTLAASTVTGTSGSPQDITFTFSTPVAIASGGAGSYSFTIERSGSVDASNYISMVVQTGGSTYSGGFVYTESSGTWSGSASNDTAFKVTGLQYTGLHTVDLQGNAGKAAQGTSSGTTSNAGGGGGGGGAYCKLSYGGSGITAGSTTIAFKANLATGTNTLATTWESSTGTTSATTCYMAQGGQTASTTTGGATVTLAATAGTPTITYSVGSGVNGAAGGSSGKNLGGGGGAGSSGPGGIGLAGATPTGTGGGGGGGANGGSATAGSNSAGSNGGNGGAGSGGTGGGTGGTGNGGAATAGTGGGGAGGGAQSTTTNNLGGNSDIQTTVNVWDATHGPGGGGGGGGCNTQTSTGNSTGGSALDPGGGAGGGGGGIRGTGGTFIGTSAGGMIIIFYSAQTFNFPSGNPLSGSQRLMIGPRKAYNLQIQAADLPAVTAAPVTPTGSTLPMMGVG